MPGQSQDDKYQVLAIGFYNLENLFDTLDTENVDDHEFTPEGPKAWNSAKYREKIANMASVISQIGKNLSNEGVSILGVSEIENRQVLEDVISHPLLADRNYDIVHKDSPDERGIDVALIYDKDRVRILNSRWYDVDMTLEGEGSFTRDIQFVSTEIDGEIIHFTVNHWPSRRGGQARSAKFRKLSASINRKIVDSLYSEEPEAKIVIMGDLNDNPNDDSLRKILRSHGKKRQARVSGLFNPMESLYNKGIGSNAWRDTWSLFDQVIVSASLLNDSNGYYFHNIAVFNKNYLIQKRGQYKGYPMRTYVGDTYQGGYSDHFPVVLYLLRKIK